MKNIESPKVLNRSIHMANERTFLAWMRTSIGIMAFGFVVEKFALFIKQISYYLGKSGLPKPYTSPSYHGYSSTFGIFLVGLGAFMGALAFFRYKKIERQIDEDSYQPSSILSILLTLSVLLIGIFLVVYLILST
ncbi:MAG: YidH family protein [Ignavibacteriaceae bacterium]